MGKNTRSMMGLALMLAYATGIAAAAENPLLGKWVAIQPKNESMRISKTVLGKIEFRPHSEIIPTRGEVRDVIYRVVDDHTVFVKIPVGPKDAPGEKYTLLKNGRLRREVPFIAGGVVEYRRAK